MSNIPNEDDIVYIDKLNPDITRIIAYMCKNIRNNIDISSNIITYVINNQSFIDDINFIHSQLLVELNNSVINYNLTKKKGKEDIFLSSMNLCGHVKLIYKNGIHEYCNLDKYLHINDNYEKQIDGVICDHKYIEKSSLVHEVHNDNIISFYQSYLDMLYLTIYNIFIYYLYEKATLDCVYIYNIDKLNFYYSKSLNHKNVFKEKTINNNYVKIYTAF